MTTATIFNEEKQREILKQLSNEQLFKSLENNFEAINEKIFCAVRTPDAIKKLIWLTLDIFREKGIFIHNLNNNQWKQIDHFNFTFAERLIKLYDQKENEMVFAKIGIF